ncbi:hypothetical protein HN011_004097 [Eciton burchellii]|nr:hypothetical protein HN011_004097 [Eciton burchellii]
MELRGATNGSKAAPDIQCALIEHYDGTCRASQSRQAVNSIARNPTRAGANIECTTTRFRRANPNLWYAAFTAVENSVLRGRELDGLETPCRPNQRRINREKGRGEVIRCFHEMGATRIDRDRIFQTSTLRSDDCSSRYRD